MEELYAGEVLCERRSECSWCRWCRTLPNRVESQPRRLTLFLLLLPLGRGVTRVRRVRQMVDCPPQTVPNLHPSPPCDCPASYSARRRRIDLFRLMVTLLAPLGALERPAQEPQSGALVHVQIVSSIAVEHFPIANTPLEMPSASLVSSPGRSHTADTLAR